MPMTLSTPEDWFRTQQRDLYELTYQILPEVKWDSLSESEQKLIEKKFRQARDSMRNWFAEALSEVVCHTLGPSEYSGFIVGGPSYLVADFSEASLAQFQAKWCGPDSPWGYEVWPFATWREQLDSCQLIAAPLKTPVSLSWWDTPAGFIFITRNQNGDYLSQKDAWLRLHELQPQLRVFQFETLPYGKFYPAGKDYESNLLIVDFVFSELSWSSRAYSVDLAAIQRLRSALGLSQDAPLRVEHGDF